MKQSTIDTLQSPSVRSDSWTAQKAKARVFVRRRGKCERLQSCHHRWKRQQVILHGHDRFQIAQQSWHAHQKLMETPTASKPPAQTDAPVATRTAPRIWIHVNLRAAPVCVNGHRQKKSKQAQHANYTPTANPSLPLHSHHTLVLCTRPSQPRLKGPPSSACKEPSHICVCIGGCMCNFDVWPLP